LKLESAWLLTLGILAADITWNTRELIQRFEFLCLWKRFAQKSELCEYKIGLTPASTACDEIQSRESDPGMKYDHQESIV
jgi:hypothetical protein